DRHGVEPPGLPPPAARHLHGPQRRRLEVVEPPWRANADRGHGSGRLRGGPHDAAAYEADRAQDRPARAGFTCRERPPPPRVTATTPTAVSSTQVKSRVCAPSPKTTGRSPAARRPTNFGITSALLPVACSRGPYELNGRITVTGRP